MTDTAKLHTDSAQPSLVSVLRERAALHPDAPACTYLGDNGQVKDSVSYAELDAQARAIAARLQGLGAAGECAILLYPPGLEFLSAFFGCLYSGVIAVPLPVPRVSASLRQFSGIVGDLDSRLVLTTERSLSRLQKLDTDLFAPLSCLATESTAPALARAWREPAIDPAAVAYLQYTSGSTSDRKGVIVSHANVIANLHGIAERFAHHADSVSVNWLPHFHDLGLVSGLLQPLYHGHPNILLSPTAFVQQPFRWLHALSTYRGTYSNSPNYGYELCVRRVTDAQIDELDLSCWDVALNGAEPVRWQTIEAFARKFSRAGFRTTSMYPAYGLAEATLVVTGADAGTEPHVLHVDANALEDDRIVAADAAVHARALVACGRALAATDVAIVDPASRRRLADNEIGEIRVRGPAVAAGYWRREAETLADFGAELADTPGSRWLCTGDLGFLRDGELFITGRAKDLIIIRGGNHYPQDIEWTIEQSHPAFRAGCGAAFSVDTPDGEQLVVACEIERDYLRELDPAELGRIARRAVAEAHDLQLATLVLLKTGTVPRTSSGKIQRRQCRASYLAGELDSVGEDAAERIAPAVTVNASRRDPDELIAWLREYASERLNSRVMDERRAISPPVLLDFGNAGVLGLQVPRSHGGCEFGCLATMRVLAQLGAIDPTLAMMTIVHNTLGIGPIMHAAPPALRDELLPRLASGRELAAFAITEPGAGSNPQAIGATATPDGTDVWRLDGEKIWSGTAGWASVINVFAQNIDAHGQPHGMSGFAVDRATRGLVIGPEALTLGMRGMVQNAIRLDHALVPRERLLGEAGGGFALAREAMMQGRLAIGAACVGGLKRCVQLMLRYAERRDIATGRLRDNPVLRHRIGELGAATAAVEGLVVHIAEALDRGEAVPLDAYVVCKTAGPEWFWRAADDLVQFLGGRGYIETNIAPQLLRDARVTRILEGPTEPLLMFLGSRVLNDAGDFEHLLTDGLGAAELFRTVAAAAAEIAARAERGPFTAPADAQRWACMQIGQFATEAVLLAVLNRADDGSAGAAFRRQWAEHRFAGAIDAARGHCGEHAVALDGAGLDELRATYAEQIGDIEQSLAGEDHALDPLLRRATISPRQVAATEPAVAAPVAPAAAATTPAQSAHDIERFVTTWVGAELKIDPATIDPQRSFFDYGVDSVTTVMLVVALEEWLGRDIYPEMVYDFPLIRDFAIRLAAASDD